MKTATLYRWVMQAHSWLPYRLMRNGHAFPAWHYYLEVTRRCNLRCVMCQYINWLRETSPSVQREGELSGDEWRRVIDQTGRWSLLTFTGGEPLLRSDFLDLLEYAGRKRRVHFITNATLLDAARAQRCVTLAPRGMGGTGLNFIGVSLDGPEGLHDRIRAMPGAFAKVMSGIGEVVRQRRTLGKKCPMIHITSVIQARNVDVLPGMVEVAADAGAEVLNLTLEIRIFDLEGIGQKDPAAFDAEALSRPRIEPGRLAEALAQTRQAAAKAGIELRTPSMPDSEIVAYYDTGWDLGRFMCRNAWTTLIVGRTGDVYPCFLRKVGNVREQSLKSIWRNEAMRAFRRRFRGGLFNLCQGCCFIEYKGEARR